MSKQLFYILTIVLILSACRTSQAQQVPDTVGSMAGVSITTSVDKAEIYIGDLITYKVTIQYDSTLELIPPPLGANLGAFDVKDYQSDILTRLDDGRFQSQNIFVLSTFTTGDYVIPPIPVVFNMPDGTKKALLSDVAPIKVLSLLGNANDSTDIKPPKAQYEFKRDLTKYYIYGAAGLLLLLVAVLLIWLRLRRKKETDEPVDLRPAWEIAFENLALLRQKNLPQNNQFKQFYFELTEILRSYYEKMYQFSVMDMTTEEFLAVFRELVLPDGHLERTKRFFAHADLVKFAKHIPEIEKTDEDFEEVHQAIELVRVDYERSLTTQVNVSTAGPSSEPTPPKAEVAS